MRSNKKQLFVEVSREPSVSYFRAESQSPSVLWVALTRCGVQIGTTKGTGGDVLILEEAAYCDEGFFYETVAPILSIGSASLVAISTLTSEINFYTRLIQMIDPATERPLFAIRCIDLCCDHKWTLRGRPHHFDELVTYFCHTSSVRSTSDGRGPVTRKRVPDREEQGCDDTEFVTLGDRTVVSRSSRYKGIFTGNKLSFALPFMFRVSFHNASPSERTVLVPFPHRW